MPPECLRSRRSGICSPPARAAHPERFATDHLPKILHLPDEVWINKPEQQPADEQQIP
jgi:hypothetical protein